MVLPNLTDLRNVVSRLGHLAENIRISANQVSCYHLRPSMHPIQSTCEAGGRSNVGQADWQEGTLEIAVSDKSVELSTTWQNLHIPHSPSTCTTQRTGAS